MLVEKDQVLAFELSDEDHRQSDIERFPRESLLNIRAKRNLVDPSIIVLDNGPKNRSRGLRVLANSGPFMLFYTKPTSPEQNFVEQVFEALKCQFARLNIVESIN